MVVNAVPRLCRLQVLLHLDLWLARTQQDREPRFDLGESLAENGAVTLADAVWQKGAGARFSLSSNASGMSKLTPGYVVTEGARTAGFVGSDFANAFVAQTPLCREGQVEDLASVAAFLASEDSKWLAGEQLRASGGLR